jgi:hypothetical protein
MRAVAFLLQSFYPLPLFVVLAPFILFIVRSFLIRAVWVVIAAHTIVITQQQQQQQH